MGNRRTVTALKVLAVMLLLVALILPTSFAYDNLTVHPALNKYAVENFITQIMPADAILKNSELSGAAKGIAWDLSDGRDKSLSGSYSQSIGVEKEKATKQWIIDGGFSADEPETAMALRHFYDPEGETKYLTDLGAVGGATTTNPQMDAVRWAFDSTENQYSFAQAKEYFKNALLEKENKNEFYGKAWRGVGETMHLIEDMTVPAHVRNDGHPPWNKEMYEGVIDEGDVEINKGYAFPALGFNVSSATATKDIKQLMKEVTKFTNNNYFSKDTVTQVGEAKTDNGYDKYAEPNLGEANANGYYYHPIEAFYNNDDSDQSLVHSMRLAKKSRVGILFKKDIAVLNWSVVQQQKTVQIPLAIRSAEAVLDAFLPRFVVTVNSVSTYPSDPTKKLVEAQIVLVPTKEWPNQIDIQNGAHILVGSTDYEIKVNENLYSTTTLTRIKFPITATDADKISVYYDFGGYKVKGDYAKKVIDKKSLLLTAEDIPSEYFMSAKGAGWEEEDHVRQWFTVFGNDIIEGEKNGNPWYHKEGFNYVISSPIYSDWWVEDRYYNEGKNDAWIAIKANYDAGEYGAEVVDPVTQVPIWGGVSGADFSGLYYITTGTGDYVQGVYTAVIVKDGLIIQTTLKGTPPDVLQNTQTQRIDNLKGQLFLVGVDEKDMIIYDQQVGVNIQLAIALNDAIAGKLK